MANAQDLLDFAAGEVGYDRYSDPEKGTKYGRWYESEVDRCADNYDFGGNGVAFCAMFASYCLAKVGVECAGFPGAYCPSIHHKQHLKVSELRAGDVVLFDWEDDGTDDHVGFVVSNDASARVVHTIEGNTNGGKVARRTRAWSTVCGGIRPKYVDAAAQPAKPAPTKPAATTKEEKVYKFATIRKGSKGNAVKLFQAAYNARYGGSLAIDGDAGKNTDAAIYDVQKRTGIATDRICGPNTWGKMFLE